MYPPYGLPHRGVILHRGLPRALLCAAALLANPFGVSLAHERPRRLVIGHVFLHGHARNGAAAIGGQRTDDRVERSEVRDQRSEETLNQRHARGAVLSSFNFVCILETVRGQREHARKCSGAHGNHQQQA
jgi:hypothetical protein